MFERGDVAEFQRSGGESSMTRRWGRAFGTRLSVFAVSVAVGLAVASVGAWISTEGRAPSQELGASASLETVEIESSFAVHALVGENDPLPLQLALERGEEIDLRGADLSIPVTLENGFERDAAAVFAVEFTDELGTEIEAPYQSSVVKLEKDGAEAIDLEIPRWLADGFYLFRVTAAGRAGGKLADAWLEIGIAVAGQTAYLLTEEEWLEHSYVNQGV